MLNEWVIVLAAPPSALAFLLHVLVVHHEWLTFQAKIIGCHLSPSLKRLW